MDQKDIPPEFFYLPVSIEMTTQTYNFIKPRWEEFNNDLNFIHGKYELLPVTTVIHEDKHGDAASTGTVLVKMSDSTVRYLGKKENAFMKDILFFLMDFSCDPCFYWIKDDENTLQEMYSSADDTEEDTEYKTESDEDFTI